MAIKAEQRRDQSALSLADSLRRLQAADLAVRSIQSCSRAMSPDLLRGVPIDPLLESLRRDLRLRHLGELRAAAGLADRLRREVGDARATLRRAQGLCDAVNVLIRLRARDAVVREVRRALVEIDDEWLLQHLHASLPGARR